MGRAASRSPAVEKKPYAKDECGRIEGPEEPLLRFSTTAIRAGSAEVLILKSANHWRSELAKRRHHDLLPADRQPGCSTLQTPSTFARRGGFLVHACAAVVKGKALVFAGLLRSSSAMRVPSFDKRTASSSMERRGRARVRLSRTRRRGVFVLQKAREHRLRLEMSSQMVAELLSRSLVPYYLGDTASRIVTLVHEAAASVPLGALECSLEPGLRESSSVSSRRSSRRSRLDNAAARSINSAYKGTLSRVIV